MSKSLLLAALSLALVGCPPSYAPAPAPGPNPNPNPGPNPGPTPTPVSTPAPAGAACNVAADCESNICEGMGCGEGQGVCAARDRACTKDLRQYCGCDGVTFNGSGSCPMRRYASAGACQSDGGAGNPARTNLADGAACSAAAECASGICEGMGCGPDAGVCVAKSRACTMDIRQYCGCDGVTFQSSGSCPGRLYKKTGACEG